MIIESDDIVYMSCSDCEFKKQFAQDSWECLHKDAEFYHDFDEDIEELIPGYNRDIRWMNDCPLDKWHKPTKYYSMNK